jgi:hypothetical protein
MGYERFDCICYFPWFQFARTAKNFLTVSSNIGSFSMASWCCTLDGWTACQIELSQNFKLQRFKVSTFFIAHRRHSVSNTVVMFHEDVGILGSWTGNDVIHYQEEGLESLERHRDEF